MQLHVVAAAEPMVACNKELSYKCMYMKLCIDVYIMYTHLYVHT